MNTVTIFGKTFTNATEALISSLDKLDQDTELIDELDSDNFPGLATAFNYYCKRGLTPDITKYLIETILGETIEQVTDDLIAKAAWEIVDYIGDFETC